MNDFLMIKAATQEINEEEKTIVGWASVPTIDRQKELIEHTAWNLDNFRKNPILCLAHDHKDGIDLIHEGIKTPVRNDSGRREMNSKRHEITLAV